MKQQRGKVSKPRGLVQRREQADKEVKSWSPSKPSYSDFVVSFLDDVPLSFIQTEPFSFLQAYKKGKRKNSTIKGPRNNMLKQKQKKHEHEHQSKKKRCDYRILSDYIKHQTSTREVREVSESRYPRSADYIYIYILSTSEKYIKR